MNPGLPRPPRSFLSNARRPSGVFWEAVECRLPFGNLTDPAPTFRRQS